MSDVAPIGPTIIVTPPRVTIDELCNYKKPDWSHTFPPLLARYRATLSDCQREGVDFYTSCAYRSWDDQTTAYLLGRNTVGPKATPAKPLGDTVTNARAGQSGHQFGVAIDSTRDRDIATPGLQPDWTDEHYECLARNAKKNELVAGYYWTHPDRDHVELDLASHGLSIPMLCAAYRKPALESAKMAAVWDVLRAHGPW